MNSTPSKHVPGRSLRIGMVCPYSVSIPGGVQAQVLGLSRQLRSMGHEVRVLAPCDGPPPAPFVTPLGNSLPTAANGSVAPLAPDASAALRTIRALRDEEFDVLHLHEPFAPGPTLTAALVQPAPIVATFHAAGESASYRMLGRQLRWLGERISRRVAVSNDARELVSRYIGGEYEILYNGVELTRFAPDDNTRTEAPTIFFCGRHEPRKGLDVLLEAMQFLPSNIRLWIASDGPDTLRLQSEYSGDQRIEWLGRISDDEKLQRMHTSHVYCAPSLRGESFGVVLLEAMASRVPIVASDIDGYRNVATDDVDALLVEPGNARELADAIHKVINDELLASRLTEAGSHRASQFSMESLAHRYVELYVQAISEVPVKQSRTDRMIGMLAGFGRKR